MFVHSHMHLCIMYNVNFMKWFISINCMIIGRVKYVLKLFLPHFTRLQHLTDIELPKIMETEEFHEAGLDSQSPDHLESFYISLVLQRPNIVILDVPWKASFLRFKTLYSINYTLCVSVLLFVPLEHFFFSYGKNRLACFAYKSLFNLYGYAIYEQFGIHSTKHLI